MKFFAAFLIFVVSLASSAVLAQSSSGSVARAVFSSNIQDREPIDSIDQFNADSGQIFFFTELKDLEGQTVKHRWLFNGEQMAEVNFNVAGARWRVWSSKQLMPNWQGEWKVEIVDGSGSVLSTNSFNYKPMGNDTSANPATPQSEAVEQQDETAEAQIVEPDAEQ